MRQALINMQQIAPQKAKAIARFLDGNRFIFYSGYPSILHALAVQLEEQNLAVEHGPVRVFLGAENGIYVSFDDGAAWQSLRRDLPVTPVHGIEVKGDDIVIATHGRSIWILDDISAFQQAPSALGSAAYLFDMRPASSFNAGSFRPAFGSPGDRRFWGKNPDFGAAVTYYLREPARVITARVTDASGAVVRELSPEDFEGRMGTGVNRVHWDLRHNPLADSLIPACDHSLRPLSASSECV